MLALYAFAAIIMLGGRILGTGSTENGSMPLAEFPWDDGYLERGRHEIEQLKSTNENLSLRLKVQQISLDNFQSQLQTILTKLNIMENQTTTQIFTKLDAIANQSDIQKNFYDENSKKFSDEIATLKSSNEAAKLRLDQQQSHYDQLLNELKRVDLKLSENFTSEVKAMLEKLKSEDQIKKLPPNCAEALKNTHQSGVYKILLSACPLKATEVYCDSQTHGGDWTVIQRRQDGSVDFFRNWVDYQQGFGNPAGEYFIGLDALHALTTQSRQMLLVVLKDFDNNVGYAKYDDFRIAGEADDYKLSSLGKHSGDAGDSLNYGLHMRFSTKDRDNDKKDGNCAVEYHGAWWYNGCYRSNLNGLYIKNARTVNMEGIIWHHWKGNWNSLKSVEMLIKPKPS